MKSSYKRLLPLAAIAAIGLAASPAVFAQAQPPAGPQPFQCAPGEWYGKVETGANDNFVIPGPNNPGVVDPKPMPSAQFQASIPAANLGAATNTYDQTVSDYHFGDTMNINVPIGATITKVRLTTRLKPNSGATNDGINFYSNPVFGGFTGFGFAINTLPGAATWAAPHPSVQFAFDFPPTGTQISVNNVSVNLMTYNGPAFYAALAANRKLDVYVQDDTSVDYLHLDVCAKEAPKYDLVATKKHDGNVYILNVTNAGSPIMPTGKIDVIEVVPAGLTIFAFTPPPGWACPSINFPVSGPDAFTCTFAIPAGGIPTNGNLPPIVFKTEGKPECPNCMRARLFLKSVFDGVKPVNEGDMKNNVSCAK